MPERPDLRKIAADIREALETYPREALADILTYVFQAYVVEGTPTVAATLPERITELEGLSFAEVIAALQARLDLPELALFDVSGGRVTVRVGGQPVPLVPERGGREALTMTSAPPVPPAPVGAPASTAGAPAAAPPAAQAAPRETRPDGGPPRVSVEEVPSSQLRPPPPPRRGLSVSSNPGSGGAPPAPSGGAARPAAAQPAQPAQPAQGAAAQPQGQQQAGKASTSSDTAAADDAGSKRFSLLDID